MKSETLSISIEELDQIQTVDPLDSDTTLLIVFANREVKADVFTKLIQRFPKSTLIGCSTSGQIFDDTVIDDNLVIGVMKFEKTQLKLVSSNISETKSSFEAGEDIAQQLNSNSLKAIFLLSDGLLINGSELILGINSIVSEDISVTGGLAGDSDKFESTWVLCDGKPKVGFVTAVGFYGEHFQVAHGSAGGWDKFGVTRTVTKSKGNILYSLDNRPALDLYKEYLGERASGLPSTGLLFPLSLYSKKKESEYLVRTILAVDELANSLTFAGDIPMGSKVQLMRANFDRLVDGATQSATVLLEMAKIKTGLAIAISCVGRRLVLGERTDEEVEATLEKLPEGTKQIGFYSYGEISPCTSGYCDLHNQTMTLTLFNEN